MILAMTMGSQVKCAEVGGHLSGTLGGGAEVDVVVLTVG